VKHNIYILLTRVRSLKWRNKIGPTARSPDDEIRNAGPNRNPRCSRSMSLFKWAFQKETRDDHRGISLHLMTISSVIFLDRFHLIIPEIGILSSGNQVSEFLLPLNHLYQECAGPGLREVPVDTFQLSGSRKICISFGNLEDENGKTESWRNTYRRVDLKGMSFVPGGFSCTNLPTSCTWRKVVDGYKSATVRDSFLCP